MIQEADVKKLQTQLEELKTLQVAGALNEQRVWCVMQNASELLDNSDGSPLRESVEVIFHLLSTIWTNTRNKSRLAEARKFLTE